MKELSDYPISKYDGKGYRLLETRLYDDGKVYRVWGERISGRDEED